MKKLLATLVASLTFIAAAQAADMPAKPVYKAPPMAASFSWTGFYLGGHAGYGWGDESWCRTGGIGPNGCTTPVPGQNYANVDPKGWLGGVQAGFNWQSSQFVFGVEGDVSFTGMDGNGPFRTFNSTYVANSDVNYVATLAGRLGIAFDRALIYGKGGFAWMDEDNWIVNTTAGTVFARTNSVRTGWVAGAGIEYAIADGWSAKAEYNYMDFGSDTKTIAGSTGGGGTGPVTIDHTVQVVKFGVNYRFGGR
jgi:outer membrane immunogenic protein